MKKFVKTMIAMFFLLSMIFEVYACGECNIPNDLPIGDINLTPGLFFPNSNNNNDSNLTSNGIMQNNNSFQNLCDNARNIQPNIETSSQVPYIPSQTMTYTTSTINSYSQTPTTTILMYPPNFNPLPNFNSTPNYNSIPNYNSTPNFNGNNMQQNTNQSINNKGSTFNCDNTLEREQFKKCVSDALKSLRSIIENCKKTLGANAKECRINEECLESFLGEIKREPSQNHNDDKKISDMIDKPENKDTLSEFLIFLENKLEKSNRKRDSNHKGEKFPSDGYRYRQEKNYPEKLPEDKINRRAMHRREQSFNGDKNYDENKENDTYENREYCYTRYKSDPCESRNDPCEECKCS